MVGLVQLEFVARLLLRAIFYKGQLSASMANCDGSHYTNQ